MAMMRYEQSIVLPIITLRQESDFRVHERIRRQQTDRAPSKTTCAQLLIAADH